jgi:hypothetical protein
LPQPPPAPPRDAASRRRSAQSEGDRFTGVVRDLERRQATEEQGSPTLWNFRLERYDASGDRLPPVPVEMRGYSFSGAMSNGDQVSLKGEWRDGTLRVQEVDNLTTSAQVRARSYRALRTVIIVVFVIFFLVMVGLILSSAISQCSAPWPSEP